MGAKEIILIIGVVVLVSMFTFEMGLVELPDWVEALIPDDPQDTEDAFVDPVDEGGFWQGFVSFFRNMANFLGFIFAIFYSFVAILTFRMEIPFHFNAILVFPLLAGFFYIMVRLVRGGG